MIFNNINKETKMEILTENLLLREKNVYSWIIKLGIEPSQFDPDAFRVEQQGVSDEAVIQERQQLKNAIDILNVITGQISLLEV
jgi:hypothetical protein